MKTIVLKIREYEYEYDTTAYLVQETKQIELHMLTSPVAAARAAVATGAWVKSKHDMYLIRGSVGA